MIMNQSQTGCSPASVIDTRNLLQEPLRLRICIDSSSRLTTSSTYLLGINCSVMSISLSKRPLLRLLNVKYVRQSG